MMLLAVDTSTTSCSVALLEGGQLLFETIYTAGKTHSRHLMSIIDQALGACRCDIKAVDGFAVSRGPGTFTGLRIGISTVKGLAAATGKPVVGISSLAALALPLSSANRPVMAMIDARRGEVYWAAYQDGSMASDSTGPPAVCAPDLLARSIPDGAILAGSGAQLYRDLFMARCPTSRFAPATQHWVRASSVGLLAVERFQTNNVDSVDRLVPQYIRKSDAQIQPAR